MPKKKKLKGRIHELEVALKPFSDLYRVMDELHDKEDSSGISLLILIGDLRQAYNHYHKKVE